MLAHADAAQRTLDLAEGPLFRAVLYRLPAPEKPRLLLIVHHLVVDGVSWRILIQDFGAALLAPPSPLPTARPAFSRWARGLQAATVSPRIAAQAAFWLEEATGPAVDLPAIGHAPATEGDARTVETQLAATVTDHLLRTSPQRLRASVQEILLTALAEAAAPLTGAGESADRPGRPWP